jgi:TPR repeat protein
MFVWPAVNIQEFSNTISTKKYRQESISMSTGTGRLFRVGILAFSLFSSIALADPVEDLKLGEIAFNKEDLSTAITLITKSAEAGYAPAQVRIGEILDASEFDKEASDWYRKAAEQGDPAGAYRLGHMYAVGEGLEKNSEKALYWFNRAAAKNNLLAVRTLAAAYRNGELGLTINLDKANSYDDKAQILEAAARQAEIKREKEAEKAKTGAKK